EELTNFMHGATQGGHLRVRSLRVGGESGEYVYTNAVDNTVSGLHLYLRPNIGGEVRATETGTTNNYVNMRIKYLILTGGIEEPSGNRFFVQPDYVGSMSTYNRTYTSNSQAMRVTANGVYGRITSSRRYKLCEEPVEKKLNPYNILLLQPKTWFDKRASEDYADKLTYGIETEYQRVERIGGLIAE